MGLAPGGDRVSSDSVSGRPPQACSRALRWGPRSPRELGCTSSTWARMSSRCRLGSARPQAMHTSRFPRGSKSMRHSARNQFCRDSFSLRSSRRAPSPLLPPALREADRRRRRARGATGPPRRWHRPPSPAGALPERVGGRLGTEMLAMQKLPAVARTSQASPSLCLCLTLALLFLSPHPLTPPPPNVPATTRSTAHSSQRPSSRPFPGLHR